MGGRPRWLEMLTIHPLPRRLMSGSTSWISSYGAHSCTSTMSLNRFSGKSSTGRRKVTAALFTRMSTGPSCWTVSVTNR